MSSGAVNLHVERTEFPGVLRWVCHLEALPDGSHQPPSGTALRGLLDDGCIDAVTVRDGDLLIRFARPDDVDDAATVAAVHRAVADALHDTGWFHHPVSTEVRIRTR